MPRLDVVIESPIERTPRVMQIEGLFDLRAEALSRRSWSLDVPLEQRPWNIGLIVGPSGAGKTTLANHLFGSAPASSFDWPRDRSLLDGFPSEASARNVARALNAVGFSSPPSWLRPFHALSNGEQFRVSLARAMIETDGLIVFDEFTSVVDRVVAQIGSASIAKAVRQAGRQFVAVSCHYDIVDWLQPDWILQPATGEFEWRGLCRRPDVRLDIVSVAASDWRIFHLHHYLSARLQPAARCFAATWRDRPVAFSAWTRFPHPKVPHAMREHRTVVLPDFQGVGVGNALSETLARHWRSRGFRAYSTTSAPAMIRHRAKSPFWRMSRAPSHMTSVAGSGKYKTTSQRRLTASFEFIG
jgi:ABC-type lipoprotein export system ATPase subunit